MVLKLVVLILVLGGSGVGVLSMRQSRLNAAHETTESRLRVRALERETRSLRTRIASSVTPEALRGALENADSMVMQTNQRVTPDVSVVGREPEPVVMDPEPVAAVEDTPVVLIDTQAAAQIEEEEPWILGDGSRVIFIDDLPDEGSAGSTP